MTEEYELSTYETQLLTYVLASSSVLVRRRKGRIAAVGHKRLAYWLDGASAAVGVRPTPFAPRRRLIL